jgi:hypothetical protein
MQPLLPDEGFGHFAVLEHKLINLRREPSLANRKQALIDDLLALLFGYCDPRTGREVTADVSTG